MTDPTAPGNKKDRLDWFNDIGFGLFIHWSIDSQIGSVIGHSGRRLGGLPQQLHPDPTLHLQPKKVRP
jgi:hypothetical protein